MNDDERLKKLLEEDLLYDIISLKVENNLYRFKKSKQVSDAMIGANISEVQSQITKLIDRYMNKNGIEGKEVKKELLMRVEAEKEHSITKAHYDFLKFFISEAIPTEEKERE